MICVPILARNSEEALTKMAAAAALADLVEVRLDLMERFEMDRLVAEAPRPLIVTYRSRKQGGRGTAGNPTRTEYLLGAAQAGAPFLDVEYSLPLEVREEIFHERGQAEIILSHHHLNGTPDPEDLARRLRNMAATGAAVIKIITLARKVEDNLAVLGLIPQALALGVRIIAFCMGPLGRLSRIGCVPMGGFLTFASLAAGEESADGQIPAAQMKGFLELLKT